MVETYTPDRCQAVAGPGGRAIWIVHATKPNGEGHSHQFPVETPHWRAAEYGISDPATILEIILHEVFQHPEDEHFGTNIYAMTAATALTMHLRRIAHIKATRIVIDHTHEVFDAFHAHHGLSPAAIQPFRIHVAQQRQLHAARSTTALSSQAVTLSGPPTIVAPPPIPRRRPIVRPAPRPIFIEPATPAGERSTT